MKVLLAGAFGKLGTDVLKTLVREGHDVLAIDMVTRDIDGIEGKYEKKVVDVTKPDQVEGICAGREVVVTTVGLTRGFDKVTNYDIDYQGNLNLLNDAVKQGVKNFAYVSVLKADDPRAVNIPMLDAKAKLEKKLKASGLQYTIYRPTGYFYDIVKVFKPMIAKGKVTLLGKDNVSCNVIDTTDLADFMVEHMLDDNKTYNIGGTETYTYEEIANMMFAVNNKTPNISRAPEWLFDVLAWIQKIRKTGKEGLIRFSKWTMTESMVADTQYGKLSFKKYIEENGKVDE
ncbi:MAG: NAD(P)H-binding protein [Solobacterium sp.]|nr:NAD(P)H-binding protein [Solobacterium sp.]